jgi:hypothetical protein
MLKILCYLKQQTFPKKSVCTALLILIIVSIIKLIVWIQILPKM